MMPPSHPTHLHREVRKLPFFLYAYVDEEIIVARGRSGGLALWIAADSKWQVRYMEWVSG